MWCLSQEGAALLSFKAAVNDPDGYLRNWNTWDESPCSWSGLTCSGLRVVSLRLPKARLVGSISPSLGTLSSLRHINLRNNELRGSLPVGLFDAQGLQSLVLDGNNFSGSVPSEMGKLKNLQVLDLSQNSFNSSLPVSLLQCRRLKVLRLSYNGFAGALPDGLGASLSMLELLDLSHNAFDGHIPNDLGHLSHLQGTVDLSHNIFSGFIPTNLGDLPEKVYIDLSNNNLTGPIPQNGALVNRGPTAFLGNPGLCGPPLKNPCSSEYPSTETSPLPHLPNSYSPPLSDISNRADGTKRKALSRVGLIAIVVGDVVGIILLGFAFFYCFGRVVSCKGKSEDDSGWKRQVLGKECFCLRDESDTPSENMEQLDLVPLDPQLNFDMEELLKASAFVLGKSGIGIVYKVVLEGGLTFAVRRLGEGGLQRFREFQTEVEAIGKLRHDNIVALRAYYWSVEEKLLIYDYIPNGNLATALNGNFFAYFISFRNVLLYPEFRMFSFWIVWYLVFLQTMVAPTKCCALY